ncbi:heterokaryon incompatibility protein-domain-containing protein [Xylaria venustula]|nr:heterokaryon incompatibility protein-domain-containing protein [Xylaria venustula]
MDSPACMECLDLNYTLFRTECDIMKDADLFDPITKYSVKKKYRVLDFSALRASALRGCPWCDILTRGFSLFWGETPERCYNNEVRGYDLVLQLIPAQSLRAFRQPQNYIPLAFGEGRLVIEFFTEENQKPVHPVFRNAPQVSRSLSPMIAAQTLQSWLQRCGHDHAACSSPLAALPSRILDLSEACPRLIEFQNSEFSYARYATLSHCWGPPQGGKPTKTTKENLESRKAGVSMLDLSPLFQDAILLCRMVGCYYIWIDSLCIIQDDNSDWKEQSQKMAEIYSNAWFNIAATGFPDSTRSMFQDRWSFGSEDAQSRRPVQSYRLHTALNNNSVQVRQTHRRDHEYLRGVLIRNRSEQAPLIDRAWAFQEILLSQRIIHVCSSELIWECQTLQDCECKSFNGAEDSIFNYVNLKQQLRKIKNIECSTEEIYDLWLQLCETYSTRSLSFASDRLAAISGIAHAMRTVTNSGYFWGIWLEDLPRSIVWRGWPISDPTFSRLPDIPSWSWLSRVSPFHDSFGASFPLPGFRQETKTSVKILDGDALGQSQFIDQENWPRSIMFEGPALSAVCRAEFNEVLERLEYFMVFTSALDADVFSWVDCPKSLDDPLQDGDSVEFLLFGANDNNTIQYAMIVRKVDRVGEHYRRVGYAEFLVDEDDSYFDDAEVKTITLL